MYARGDAGAVLAAARAAEEEDNSPSEVVAPGKAESMVDDAI